MSSVIWGNWRTPVVQFEPYRHPSIGDVEKRVLCDIGQRLTWNAHYRILDGVLYSHSGSDIKGAEKSMAVFQTLFGVAGSALVAFEIVARKYSIFSGPYFKIIGVVGLAFIACRYWGAYCYKREIERQITQVAKDRTGFYKHKQHSALNTQILHPFEGEYWAQQLDAPFAEWLTKYSQKTTGDPAQISAEINAFLADPPFKNSHSFSKQILDLCVSPSPIVTSYEEFAAALKECREILFRVIGNCEENVMEIVVESRPQIKKITRNLFGSQKETAGHYCDLAYQSLIPKEFQEAIARSKNGDAKVHIEKQLYDKIQEWKNSLENYRNNKCSSVYIPDLRTVRSGFPLDSVLRKKVVAITVNQWKESALTAQPEKGTQEEYQEYIEKVGAGGENGWTHLNNLPPRKATDG